ncbi:MAG: zinc ribbon domain-containing protein [Spirochaetaceae bacterium]|jgi:RNA polymerase subunit RPABC4/transcription elongation factor Spt4|nr:zinc ribbon domain-containing protein [Spirochaetaceae bacterium]MDT8298372.1 zinc ribbon domain-containing protein [Spirochaetaceae bacterium]
MEKVRFCRHCGELLEIQWIHCPWCGIEVIQTRDEWDAMVDVSLEKTEKVVKKQGLGKLDDISGRLDDLESELDAFLAGRR